MKKKIEKNSPEWTMFNEFYKLRQEYHDAEYTEEFWDAAIKDVSEFIAKYKNDSDVAFFSDGLGRLLLDDMEYRGKKKNEKETHNG